MIRGLDPMAQVDLRADPHDAAAMGRLRAALGVALPTISNTVTRSADGDRHALWLGPDEWLIVGPNGTASAIEAAARDAAADAVVTTVDVSGNRVVLEVDGARARDLLAFGCSLDLDDRAFPVWSCAQANVARANVVLWRRAPERWSLLVRPSFAAYLQAWLEDARAGLG